MEAKEVTRATNAPSAASESSVASARFAEGLTAAQKQVRTQQRA